MAPNFQVYAKTWLRFARLLPIRTSHRLWIPKVKSTQQVISFKDLARIEDPRSVDFERYGNRCCGADLLTTM